MADRKSIFNEDNIRLNAAFATKEEAIRAAGQILADNGYVKEEYIDDMLKREEVVSTYIGNHIAIPPVSYTHLDVYKRQFHQSLKNTGPHFLL